MNHFFIAYPGNKRKEIPHIYDYIKNKLDEVDTIIEPFCGSSACSYFISQNHPKKFKYILNDNDKYLIELYRIFQNDEHLDKFNKDVNETVKQIVNKEEYLKIIKQDNIMDYYISNKIYRLRAGMYNMNYKPKEYNLKDCLIYNFLKNENIEFLNKDAIEIIEQYKNDTKAFIILDPPYLTSCNCFYRNPVGNIYEYLFNNDVNKMLSKIILILENNWIIKLLFNNNSFIEYNKIYEGSKKQTTHKLIANFTIL